MAIYTCTINKFNKGLGHLVGGTIDLDTPDIRVMLLTSSWTPDAAANEFVADISANESSGGGYARLSMVAEAKSEPTAGVWMFDSNDLIWTAAGGNIVAKYFAMYAYNAADAAAPLICYGLIDSGGSSVTTTDGNTLKIIPADAGWFRWQ